jgi:hypothetical protein
MNNKTKNEEFLSKVINGRRTNLYEWVKKIDEEFYQEKEMKEHTSLDAIKTRFYENLDEFFSI